MGWKNWALWEALSCFDFLNSGTSGRLGLGCLQCGCLWGLWKEGHFLICLLSWLLLGSLNELKDLLSQEPLARCLYFFFKGKKMVSSLFY